MDWVLVSIVITAIATVAIAIYSWASLKLSQAIKNQEETYRNILVELTKRHQSELKDLYQAITIATLIGGHSNTIATSLNSRNFIQVM